MQVPSKVNNAAEQIARTKKASDEALAKKNSLLQASRIEENDNKIAHKDEPKTNELLEENLLGKETPVIGNLEKRSDIQNSDKDESKDTSNANLSGGGKVNLEANRTIDSIENHTLNGVPTADAKNVEANQNDEANKKMSSISSATPTGLASVVSGAQSAVSGVLTGTPSVGAAGDKTSPASASSATPTGLASVVSGAQSVFANEGKCEIFNSFIYLLYLTICTIHIMIDLGMSSEIDANEDDDEDEDDQSDNSYLDEFEGTSLEKVDEVDDEDDDDDDEGFEVWDPSLIQKVADAQAEKVRTGKVRHC